MPGRRTVGRALVALALLTGPGALSAQSRLQLELGVDSAGLATPAWDAVLHRRLGAADYDRVRAVQHRLTPGERGWYELIRGELPSWEAQVGEVAALYVPAPPPPAVRIVAGNRGASDAFTHDPRTIGFDLSALLGEYGPASLPANADRIDRLFRHEYAHLMQKAWLARTPFVPESAVDHALLELWLEGLGTYHSFSEPWRAVGDAPSARALETLATMEPRLLVRLAALSCAGPADRDRLAADLSQGPFRQKWGSVTVGLWIEQEAAAAERRDDALRAVIAAGPRGVWDLAARQLPPALRPMLDEIRTTGQLCPS